MFLQVPFPRDALNKELHGEASLECAVSCSPPHCVQSHTVYSSIKGSKQSCWEGTYFTLLNPGFPHLFDCKFL